MKKPLCRRCKTDKNPTKHHIYPTRWNRIKGCEFHPKLRDKTMPLCRKCHDRLENALLLLEKVYGKLPDKMYLDLARYF